MQMRILNAAIILAIGILGYALALTFDRAPPSVQVVPQETAQMHGQVPDFTVTDLQGKTVKISDFRGKAVLLNFWASWCAPCVKEFPELIALSNDSKGKIVLLALSADLDEKTVRDFLKRQNIRYPQTGVFIALDTKNIAAEIFQTYRLPETLIIDPEGIMRRKLIGANWDASELQKFLDTFSKG